MVAPGLVHSAFGDPDLRSPSGFDFGLLPSAQDDTKGGMFAQSLGFTLGFRRYFFSFKLIKSLLLWEKGDHGSGG